MIENLIVLGVAGFVSGGLGVFVGYAVLKEQIKTMKKDIEKHEKTFERVVYRDVCTGCKTNADERHEEVCRRLDLLDSKMENNQKAFRECMDDLINEIRK